MPRAAVTALAAGEVRNMTKARAKCGRDAADATAAEKTGVC